MLRYHRMSIVVSLALIMVFTSCSLFEPEDPIKNVSPALEAAKLFPFENLTNKWYYSLGNDKQIVLSVSTTFTDNSMQIYKVHYYENNLDSQDIWFRRSSSVGVEYSSSLFGTYNQFLPVSVTKETGSFSSGSYAVNYTYKDTAISSDKSSRTLRCKYSTSIFQGFAEILFAENYGIVQLVDRSNQRTYVYSLDSCTVNNVTTRF